MKRTADHLKRVEFLWPKEDVARLDAEAQDQGTDRTAVTLEFVRQGLVRTAEEPTKTLWRASGAEAQVQALVEGVAELQTIVIEATRRAIGLTELVMDWVLRTKTLRVSEDDLTAEVRRAGDDAVECLLEEIRYGRKSLWNRMKTRGEKGPGEA